MNLMINNKWPLDLPKSSFDEWTGNMLHHGEWEGPRLDKLNELITANPGCVVLYAGAYKADMPALLATWGAQLMLMEGTAGFWPLIKETWELNDLPLPLATFSGLVGRKVQWGGTDNPDKFQPWPVRQTEFIEGTTGFSHLAESGEVFPQITIDYLVQETAIVPDIITMDIEGSELEACYGAVQTLEQYKPACLISEHPEFMFHNHGTYIRELHDLLEQRGYRMEFLEFDHEWHILWTHPEGFGA